MDEHESNVLHLCLGVWCIRSEWKHISVQVWQLAPSDHLALVSTVAAALPSLPLFSCLGAKEGDQTKIPYPYVLRT